MKKNITILGAGSMGTAMAHVAATHGNKVVVWNWEGDGEPLEQIEATRENKKYMPGFTLHEGVMVEKNMEKALAVADIVFFAIPSSVIVHTMRQAAPYMPESAMLVDVSKGVEPDTYKLTPHVMEELFPNNAHVAMSGPAVAVDIMKGYFTAMDLASSDRQAADAVSEALAGPHMNFHINDDIIGTELGGAFKNVYAIALGLCDGLGYGLNTKAALLTHAMQEMGCVIQAMGGKPETVYGLSGLGDLIGTALSDHSRNRTFGQYIAEGFSIEEALEKVGQVVEGKAATEALLSLANKKEVDVPLASMVQRVIGGEVGVKEAVEGYLVG